jgi:hypothetical protein
MLLGVVAASTGLPAAFLLLAGVPAAGGLVLGLSGARRAAAA